MIRTKNELFSNYRNKSLTTFKFEGSKVNLTQISVMKVIFKPKENAQTTYTYYFIVKFAG